jgi:hypothetical protein
MADNLYTGTTTLRYPTDYNLKSLKLITSLQPGGIALQPFLIELNLFEDIYGSTVSGEIVLQDAMGLISAFGLNGTEFIQIQLQKTNTDTNFYSRNFRIYKVGDRVIGDNNSYEVFSMHFCSEEFFLSEQYRISKSFKGTQISDIVNRIMIDYLKVQKPYKIERTMGVYDFILPNKKLFETMNWLATYSISQNGDGDFVFFENSYGYSFVSLSTLYQSTPYASYKFDPKNVSDDMNQKVNNATDFEVLNFFDTLAGATNGTWSNKVVTLNVLQRKKDVTTGIFNYSQFLDSNPSTLNPKGLINSYQNRLGASMFDIAPKTIPGLEVGCLRMAVGNANDKKAEGVISKGAIDAVANDIMIEKYLPNRVGRMSLANYTRIKFNIPGDPNIAVGKVVNFSTYKIEPSVYSQGQQNAQRTVDPLYSGKYLVTAVRHIIKNNSYITVLELCKESHTGGIASFDNNNTTMKDLVNGVQI